MDSLLIIPGGEQGVESLWSEFKQRFMSVIRKFIPSRSISCRKSIPWLSKKVLRLMRSRDNAHKCAKNSDTPESWGIVEEQSCV